MLVTKLSLPNFSNRDIGAINLGRLFSKFYRRHYELVSKYETKTLLLQTLSEPEFYGDLVDKFRKIVGNPEFSDHFSKLSYVINERAITLCHKTVCLLSG